MKRILLVPIAGAAVGLSVAFSAWLFHHSPHEIFLLAFFYSVCALGLGIGVILLQRKK
jgi:hypothetical protein